MRSPMMIYVMTLKVTEVIEVMCKDLIRCNSFLIIEGIYFSRINFGGWVCNFSLELRRVWFLFLVIRKV